MFLQLSESQGGIQEKYGGIRSLFLCSLIERNTVKEIADLLGFENLSFFGKYVKTNFGKSPRNFRRG